VKAGVSNGTWAFGVAIITLTRSRQSEAQPSSSLNPLQLNPKQSVQNFTVACKSVVRSIGRRD
jgi:hypothetical protein